MIYFYCNVESIHFFIDYILSIKANYNNTELILNPCDLINIIENRVETDIFIFIQYMPPVSFDELINIKCYLFNTEQLSKEEWIQRLSINPIKIIDYSLANIRCLLPYRQDIYYLPYMVNRYEILNYEKIYDIACIGCWTDSYRLDITNKIPNINIIEGYGEQRDDQLFRHKILLNVHFNNQFQIFEQMRCNRCIMNKMIVITEKSLDVDFELKKYIIECEYDELVSTTQKVLENYEYYYNMLFSDFDIDKIEKMYKEFADITIEHLSI